MKKTKFGIVAALICALVCAAMLAACSNRKEPETPKPDNTTHTHDYVATVVAPKCAAEGYTEYKCSCGASYIDDYTEALGHEMSGDACGRCGAHATEGLSFQSVSGGYAVTGIGTANTEDLIIPATYGGGKVVEIADKAFMYNKTVKYVTLSESVKKIGEEAFFGCDELKGITLTAVEKLGRLSLCAKQITHITLPDTLKIIGASVFSSLKMDEIYIPASVESMAGGVFSGCELEKITVDPDNQHYRSVDNCVIGPVTDDDGTRTVLLFGCKNSRIPDDGSFTEIYAQAFSGVVGLDELVIPDSIVKIGLGVFRDSDMRSLKIGKGLESIGYGVFMGCDNLVSITVDPENPKYTAVNNCLIDKAKKAVVLGCKASVIPTDSAVVTAIAAYAFRECPVPESFVIPANITSIGSLAFAYSNLKSVTIYGTLTESGSTSGGGAFQSCTALKNVTFEDGVTSIPDGMFANTGIEHINLPDTITEIGAKAFASTALAEITIPSLVTELSSMVFSDCSALTQVVIPGGVTTIGEYAFANCYNLVKVTLGADVSEIGRYAFNNCYKLTELINLSKLDITKSNTSAPTVLGNIGYSVANTAFNRNPVFFEGEIYTSENYTSKLDFTDGFVFYNNDGSWELYACGLIGDITLPASYKGEDYDVATGAFVQSAVTGITVNGGVKTLKQQSMFYCRHLESVDLNGIESIEGYVFMQCNVLKNIKISDCGGIAASSVYYCDAIETIDLHNVKNIGQCAFLPGTSYSAGETDTLKRITVTGSCDSISGWAFCNFVNRDITVILSADIGTIECYAFYNCGFDRVYFTGTRQEWQNMNIEYSSEENAAWNSLNTAEVFCYSETKPSDSGNYWHYDSDGVTPVPWN